MSPPDSQLLAGGGRVRLALSRPGDADLVLHVQVAPGWHVNADTLGQEELVPTSLGGEDLVQVLYPPAKDFEAAYSELYGGGAIRIFDGDFQIQARLLPDADTRHVQVTLQACDDQICLAPETLTMFVPARPEQ